MRKFRLTYMGSIHHQPYDEETLKCFIKKKIGQLANDYTGRYVTQRKVTADDFKIEELVPCSFNINTTVEIV